MLTLSNACRPGVTLAIGMLISTGANAAAIASGGGYWRGFLNPGLEVVGHSEEVTRAEFSTTGNASVSLISVQGSAQPGLITDFSGGYGSLRISATSSGGGRAYSRVSHVTNVTFKNPSDLVIVPFVQVEYASDGVFASHDFAGEFARGSFDLRFFDGTGALLVPATQCDSRLPDFQGGTRCDRTQQASGYRGGFPPSAVAPGEMFEIVIWMDAEVEAVSVPAPQSALLLAGAIGLVVSGRGRRSLPR